MGWGAQALESNCLKMDKKQTKKQKHVTMALRVFREIFRKI